MRNWFDARITRRNLAYVVCAALFVMPIFGLITGDWEKWGVFIAYSSIPVFVFYYIRDLKRDVMRKWFDAKILLYALRVSVLCGLGLVAMLWVIIGELGEASRVVAPFVFWYVWHIADKLEREARQRMYEHE